MGLRTDVTLPFELLWVLRVVREQSADMEHHVQVSEQREHRVSARRIICASVRE